jgi:magnesium transporter
MPVADAHELTLAYVENHPDDAARVLERLPLDNTVAFLEGLPVRLGAPVIRRMLAPHAARCIETLPLEVASGIVSSLGIHSGATVLRYLTPARREHIIGLLPTASTVGLRLVLGYPEDTVGAKMDPQAPAFVPDTLVSIAMGRLREADTEIAYVYIINPDHRLQGIVSLDALLRAGSKLALAQIMQPATYSLPARASVNAVVRHPGWHHFHRLPVVEHNDRFVGALDHKSLLQINRPIQIQNFSGVDDTMAGLVAGFWRAFSALVQLIVYWLVASGQPRDSEDSDAH